MSDSNQSPTQDGDDGLSKTAKKREAERLQDVGRRIGALSAEQITALDLPANLHTAITDYQRFGSHGAKRRQLQFIGKLMRKLDTDAIEAHLQDLDGESAHAQYVFNQTEQWREALMSNPEALTEFIAQYPHVDRQHLRQMLKKLHGAKNAAHQKQQARTLFRFVREVVDE